MTPSSGLRQLRQLASLYSVQTAYYDVLHRRQSASAESLLAVLPALGASVATPEDVREALRERKQEIWRRVLEQVTVAWDGEIGAHGHTRVGAHGRAPLPVRLPVNKSGASWKVNLKLETGEEQAWKLPGGDLPILESDEVEGVQYVIKGLALPDKLPWGYHRVALEVPGLPRAETLIISTPIKAYSPYAEGFDSAQPKGQSQAWGVFLPLYALRGQNLASPSANFSHLEALAQWVGSLGGSIVATLPILAAFLDEPFEPSPYAPASRLLWNEYYVDVSRAPELEQCPEAQAILASSSFVQEIEQLRQSPLIDYRRGMALKRWVLEKLAQCCFDGASPQREALEQFIASQQCIEEYARFRATMEKQGAPWSSWPEPLQKGNLRPGDYDNEVKQYHLYAQWLAHEQVLELVRTGRDYGAELYLDLPLGVHPDGYDVWRYQDLFVREATAGAPPDAFFGQGQNWGFHPLHPEKLRQAGYDYYISYLRHHLETAGLLRIDHVMGLHRLFWVPQGLEASQGTYVRYPVEEFYAILSLESHRNKAVIVGEDLGTVPPQVRPAMLRHGLHRMYVVYFDMRDSPRQALGSVPANALASINTHDMPPFAAFWEGLDIRYREELGQQSKEGAEQELAQRKILDQALVAFLRQRGLLSRGSGNPEEVLQAILYWLGQSPASMVLVNLEDLWLETQPQNIPATGPERPNWRRKARYSLEEFSQMPQVVEVLQGLSNLRKLPRQRRG
jgi:4-alpha-glucanotransferase